MERLELETPLELPLGLGHHYKTLLPLMGLFTGHHHQSHCCHQTHKHKAVDLGDQVEADQIIGGMAYDCSRHLVARSVACWCLTS